MGTVALWASGGLGRVLLLLAVVAAGFLLSRMLGGGGGNAAAAWEAVERGALLVDVRSRAEYEAGHLEGATLIPHDVVAARLSQPGGDKSRPIVLYCRSGVRAGMARAALVRAGFTQVINGGGYAQMRAARSAK